MENPPPCFQKERNKGGILHNDVLFGQNFDYFSYCFGPLGAKKFACGAISIVFLVFVLIVAPFPLFWRPRQANVDCQLATKAVQNTSDVWWMIYRRRRRKFLQFRASKS